MSRRERLEAKIEKRREWADGRRAKAGALLDQNKPYEGDWAFATQPGHIPERARAIARSDKAAEHAGMARHHEQAADGLAHQLDRTVFSDDADAIQQLESRIAEHEAKRAAKKAVNQAWRKAGKPAVDDAEGWRKVQETAGLSAGELAAILRRIALCPYQPEPFPAYELTNLGGRIRADKERIEAIRRQTERQQQAESAGGVLVHESEGGHCSVTFAEFPGRDTINALKAAGFFWSRPSWLGRTENLPAGIRP
jgi:hypothetical protein